jgi:hypothetical protein
MRCRCHIAQINVARARPPINDPLMAGFVARLDEINALAETSPGFVWRLKDDVRSMVQAHADERVLTNLSVWESPVHLHHFLYRTAHAASSLPASAASMSHTRARPHAFWSLKRRAAYERLA